MATKLYGTDQQKEAYIRGCQNTLSLIKKLLGPYLDYVTENNNASHKKDEWMMNMLIRQNRAVTQGDIDVFKVLDKTILSCNFSTRTLKTMKILGVNTIKDLVALQMEDIMGVKGCGRKTIYEIKKFLEDRNLFLGMFNSSLFAEKYASWKAGGTSQ